MKNTLALLFVLATLTACQGEVKTFETGNAPHAPLVQGKIDERVFRTAVSLEIRVDKRGTRICSGTLIEKDLVLTAAHCMEGLISPLAGDELNVLATAKLLKYGAGRAFRVHPKHRDQSRHYDLALVRLELKSPDKAAAIALLQKDFVNPPRAAGDWIPEASQNLLLTGSGIKAGYLEAPFEPPVSQVGAFRGRVSIERADRLTPILDFFKTSELKEGDLIELSADKNSPWLCAGDSGGGLYLDTKGDGLVLAGVNSRSKLFSYQGKTLCMPSGMIVVPLGPHGAWIEKASAEIAVKK